MFKAGVLVNFTMDLHEVYMTTMLLVKDLSDDALDGRKWFYQPSNADEPCGNTEAFVEFDKQFPPKVKAYQPCQEEFYIHSHSVII